MKISQKIEQAAKEDRGWWSFEYFPPRTAQVLLNSSLFVYVHPSFHSYDRVSKTSWTALSVCEDWVRNSSTSLGMQAVELPSLLLKW